MRPSSILSICGAVLVSTVSCHDLATSDRSPSLRRDAAALATSKYAEDFAAPASWLTGWWNPSDLGEPINVVVSARSSPEVLTPDGFRLWLNSMNISQPCLGQASMPGSDNKQFAFLGPSGSPDQNLTELLTWRENFGDPLLGSCIQTFNGGFHLRAFNQTATGAIFIAASDEADLSHHHKILPDGYNSGRNNLTGLALNGGKGTSMGPPYSAPQSYAVKAEKMRGLIEAGSQVRCRPLAAVVSSCGQNINHDIATDGIITLLTVTLIKDTLTSSATFPLPDLTQVLLPSVIAVSLVMFIL
jgi:hypothetical protein